MAHAQTPIFAAPDCHDLSEPSKHPIDMNYLAGTTGGIKVMAEEILSVFAQQANLLARSLDTQPDADARQELAATLKEAAHRVGAFEMAELAQDVEEAPSHKTVLAKLIAHVDETRDYIASLLR